MCAENIILFIFMISNLNTENTSVTVAPCKKKKKKKTVEHIIVTATITKVLLCRAGVIFSPQAIGTSLRVAKTPPATSVAAV